MDLSNKFEIDQEFENYRKKHPRDDHSVFWTKREVKKVRQGLPHNSLGNNIVTNGIMDFWYTGARQAQRLLKIGNVEPAHRVVEYGCGSLRVAGHFIKLLDAGNFFGLDVIPDFYEMGVDNVGRALIEEKRPKMAVISRESVAEASAFQPDFVFAHAVVIHVHPDDLTQMFQNLASIASKPGAVLAFNVMLHDPPARYEGLGWAWPERFFSEQLPDLEVVNANRSPKLLDMGGYKIRGAMLTFRRPI
jgi:SAM-dependent methyltransferase